MLNRTLSNITGILIALSMQGVKCRIQYATHRNMFQITNMIKYEHVIDCKSVDVRTVRQIQYSSQTLWGLCDLFHHWRSPQFSFILTFMNISQLSNYFYTGVVCQTSNTQKYLMQTLFLFVSRGLDFPSFVHGSPEHTIFNPCTLNRFPHIIYWKSPISIFGTSAMWFKNFLNI